MSDALTVAARLPLTDTAQDLIHDQATWDNRFRGLRWPGDIDLLRQFNLVLGTTSNRRPLRVPLVRYV